MRIVICEGAALRPEDAGAETGLGVQLGQRRRQRTRSLMVFYIQ